MFTIAVKLIMSCTYKHRSMKSKLAGRRMHMMNTHTQLTLSLSHTYTPMNRRKYAIEWIKSKWIRWFEIEMNVSVRTVQHSTLSVNNVSYALQLKIDFHRNVNRLPLFWWISYNRFFSLSLAVLFCSFCGNKFNSSSIRMAQCKRMVFFSLSRFFCFVHKWLDWSSDENQKNGIMSKVVSYPKEIAENWPETAYIIHGTPNFNWPMDPNKTTTHFSYVCILLRCIQITEESAFPESIVKTQTKNKNLMKTQQIRLVSNYLCIKIVYGL